LPRSKHRRCVASTSPNKKYEGAVSRNAASQSPQKILKTKAFSTNLLAQNKKRPPNQFLTCEA